MKLIDGDQIIADLRSELAGLDAPTMGNQSRRHRRAVLHGLRLAWVNLIASIEEGEYDPKEKSA